MSVHTLDFPHGSIFWTAGPFLGPCLHSFLHSVGGWVDHVLGDGK